MYPQPFPTSYVAFTLLARSLFCYHPACPQGETVLPAPRVSREALISVLKEHNDILAALRSDLSQVTTFVTQIAKEAAETKAQVNKIQDEQQAQRADLNSLSDRTDKMEEITTTLSAKLDEVDEMQAAIAAQGLHLSQLQGDFDQEQATNSTFRSSTENRFEAEAARVASLEQTREQMQERLDHMHEEINITADQIIFTRDPMEVKAPRDGAATAARRAWKKKDEEDNQMRKTK